MYCSYESPFYRKFHLCCHSSFLVQQFDLVHLVKKLHILMILGYGEGPTNCTNI